MTDIQKRLFTMQDLAYKEFNSGLIPNIEKNDVIGVRIPFIRDYAKELYASGEAQTFFDCLPHRYHEENLLHAFLIEKIKDFDSALYETERFLPYIDNWAVCDSFFPPVFKKNPRKMLDCAYRWLGYTDEYVLRYGIGVMMRMYLDNNFEERFLSDIAKIKSEYYYVNMMSAWYFATALAKQYDAAVVYFEKRILPEWVHKKAIQKAIESRRVTDEHKKYLKELK